MALLNIVHVRLYFQLEITHNHKLPLSLYLSAARSGFNRTILPEKSRGIVFQQAKAYT